MSQSDFSAQPRANEPIVGRDGLVTRAWRDYFARLAMAQSSDDLQQLYEALAARVAELAEGHSLRIIGRNSVSTAGTSVVEIQLVGDEAAPGNTEYYGTGPTGQRGFFPIASAIAVDTGELEKSVGTDGVITLGLADVSNSGTGTLQAVTVDGKGRVTGTKAATITGTAQQINVANGNAAAGLPTLSLAPEVLAALAEATTALQPGDIPVHNDLSGLQGGASGEYYHLTNAQYTGITPWATIAPAAKANNSDVVHLAGVETITGQKTFDTDLIFSGAGRTFRADFSSAASIRMKVQTATVDSNTNFTIIPSGVSGRQAIVSLFNSSDAGNASGAQFAANVLEVQFNSVATGTGTLLPWSYKINNVTMLQLETGGAVRPGSDNGQSSGTAVNRWSVVYAGTGTINTSDAREKTPVRPFTPAELAAAAELGREIGVYQFLAMIEAKGNAARLHIGMTVQGAIAILESHRLDPFAYGFICYDHWGELPEIRGESGEAVQAHRPAGYRYSFRMDELLAFIARGMVHRLDAMDQRLAAAGL